MNFVDYDPPWWQLAQLSASRKCSIQLSLPCWPAAVEVVEEAVREAVLKAVVKAEADFVDL